MENILMRFCRESHGYSADTIAARLGISAQQYLDFETGKALLTPKLAKQLGRLYNHRPEYFYAAALQLEELRVCNEMVKLRSGA